MFVCVTLYAFKNKNKKCLGIIKKTTVSVFYKTLWKNISFIKIQTSSILIQVESNDWDSGFFDGS